MPSSELLRTAFIGLLKVSQLKNLLLGMPKFIWVKLVEKVGTIQAKAGTFCTLSTVTPSNFLQGTFFVRKNDAPFTRPFSVFTQPGLLSFYLFGGWFYSFSTMPNKAAKKLFKGFVI